MNNDNAGGTSTAVTLPHVVGSVATSNQPVYSRGVANLAHVVGTDKHPPILDESRLWREWSMDDIYLGQEGANKWVPKVGDFVMDTGTLKRYRVKSVNESNLIPELVSLNDEVNADEMSEDMGRFFSGHTLISPCARQIFYDDSVLRPTLTVPAQYHIQGSKPHHAIAFKGTIVGKGGVAISVRYDGAFNPISNAIPLEPILQRENAPPTQWFLPPFYTSEKLAEGEMVTIIVYDDKGGVLGRTNFIVERSALLRDVSDASKFVASISIESHYIDESDENVLLIPEGILKNSINLMGKVHYSDGTVATYPVDGNRFELIYLDAASDAVVSSTGSLVLKYYLSPNEKAVGAIHNNQRYFVTRAFSYRIIERDGSYAVKLYPIPRWVNEAVGYSLEWYMFNLDRNQWVDVTGSVQINPNSPTKRLDGKLYGPVQQLWVSIDLGTINNTFREFVHPQQVDVRLLRPASDTSGDRYNIGFEAYQSPVYGQNLVARVDVLGANHTTVNIGNRLDDLETFLDKVFYRTLPQYRTNREEKAPKPNMFKLVFNGQELDFPIRKWNDDLVVPWNIAVTDTIKVVFFSRMDTNDLFYSVAPLPVLIH